MSLVQTWMRHRCSQVPEIFGRRSNKRARKRNVRALGAIWVVGSPPTIWPWSQAWCKPMSWPQCIVAPNSRVTSHCSRSKSVGMPSSMTPSFPNWPFKPSRISSQKSCWPSNGKLSSASKKRSSWKGSKPTRVLNPHWRTLRRFWPRIRISSFTRALPDVWPIIGKVSNSSHSCRISKSSLCPRTTTSWTFWTPKPISTMASSMSPSKSAWTTNSDLQTKGGEPNPPAYGLSKRDLAGWFVFLFIFQSEEGDSSSRSRDQQVASPGGQGRFCVTYWMIYIFTGSVVSGTWR